MTEDKTATYSVDEVKLMLMYVQNKLDSDKSETLFKYLINDNYVDAIFLLRKTLWEKTDAGNQKYAGPNDDIDMFDPNDEPHDEESRGWKRMLISKSSAVTNDGYLTDDGYRYEMKTTMHWTGSQANLKDNPYSGVAEPLGSLKGYTLCRGKNDLYFYNYLNELDHIVSYCTLMLMAEGRGDSTNPKIVTEDKGNPKVFQSDLKKLAIKAAGENDDLGKWWDQFKQS